MRPEFIKYKWFATGCFIIGGTSLAFKMPWVLFAFFCLAIAHSTLLYVFIKCKDKPLIIHNLYFLIVNTIALWRWS